MSKVAIMYSNSGATWVALAAVCGSGLWELGGNALHANGSISTPPRNCRVCEGASQVARLWGRRVTRPGSCRGKTPGVLSRNFALAASACPLITSSFKTPCKSVEPPVHNGPAAVSAGRGAWAACLYACARVNPGMCPMVLLGCGLCFCLLLVCGLLVPLCALLGLCFGLGSSRMARRNCSSLFWEVLGAKLVRLLCFPLLQGTSYLETNASSRPAQALRSCARSAQAFPAVSLSWRSISMNALNRAACLMGMPAARWSSHQARLLQQKICLPTGSPRHMCPIAVQI